MNKLYVKSAFFMGIMVLTGISSQTYSQVVEQDYPTLMEKVLISYQNIGTALSQKTIIGIPHEAQQIVSITEQIMDLKPEMTEEKNQQCKVLMSRMNSHSNSLLNNEDINSLRNEYVLLSNAVIGYVNTFGSEKGYYLYVCEGDIMAWIQENKEPQQDPYCNLPCGKIIEEI